MNMQRLRTMKLTREEIRNEVERLSPFYHKIDLPYGLNTCLPGFSRRPEEATRIDSFIKHAFPTLLAACNGSLKGKRVLDVASNCGGFSFEAARSGADFVLGFDAVGHYIEQANFIKQALELENVEFKVSTIEQITPDPGGFDVTFCLGILYHLENPILAMRKISSFTRDILLMDTDIERIRFNHRPLWLMNFPLQSNSDSSDASTSLWRSTEKAIQFRPTEPAVIELLHFLGFQKVLKIEPKAKGLEKRYYDGKRAAFLAIRNPGSYEPGSNS